MPEALAVPPISATKVGIGQAMACMRHPTAIATEAPGCPYHAAPITLRLPLADQPSSLRQAAITAWEATETWDTHRSIGHPRESS